MRGDIIYEIYSEQENHKDLFFGTYRTLEEAQAKVVQLKAKTIHGENWADLYHKKGFTIREITVGTDFEPPPLPKPREKYFVKATRQSDDPDSWVTCLVDVYRRNLTSSNLEHICSYNRNYGMLQTFEPFRQGNKEFALISRDYTLTAVMDLHTGEVIAEEKRGNPPGSGFCPVGFFVPDWWDVNSNSCIPGGKYWSIKNEWPQGDFGFVWGCHWGDDSSWKVQYLDLSRIQQGEIKREERFGYVDLATIGYNSPCFDEEPCLPNQSTLPRFISLYKEDNMTSVRFSVDITFDLMTGTPDGWKKE
jgi:hypothetical protein